MYPSRTISFNNDGSCGGRYFCCVGGGCDGGYDGDGDKSRNSGEGGRGGGGHGRVYRK